MTVTAMCHPRHWERLRTLGASACREGPLPEGQPWPEAEASRFYAVVDAVSADHAARLAPALRPNGHLAGICGRVADWPGERFGRAVSLHEVALGALHRFGDDEDWAEMTGAGERLLEDIAAKRLAEETRIVRPFSELATLLAALRNRTFSGKPVVRL